MKIRDKRINYRIVRNILYTIGILLLIYYIYLLCGACSYIGGLVSVGEIKLTGEFGKVIQYIMNQTFSYLFYSITLLTLGSIISICDGNKKKAEENSEENIVSV